MWGTADGYDRLMSALKNTPIKLQLTKQEWIQHVPILGKDHNVSFFCSKCGIESKSKIGNVARLKRIGCMCTGRFKYNTPSGRKVIQKLVDQSRFHLMSPVEDLDLSRGCYSQLELFCPVCSTVVTPKVDQLLPTSCGIGCLCARPDEFQVRNSLQEMLELWDCNYKLDLQFKFFDELKGRLGKPFTADFAIRNEENEVVVIVEVDGWYHFNQYAKSRVADNNRTQDHDIIKEQWCIDKQIPLVRIQTAFVKFSPDLWTPPLWEALTNAVCFNETRICRLSHDSCYSKGPYFDRRVGTPLAVIDKPIVLG